MTRETTIPAQTIRERIRIIEHFPPYGETPGIVKVTIGRVDAEGSFIDGAQRTTMIEGDAYALLVGPPAVWAPNKPEGTWQVDDLWYFIDELHKTPDNAQS